MRTLTIFLLCIISESFAVEVLLTDDWKLNFIGNIESALIYDNTSSFREPTINSPVARPGTQLGDNGRTQLSLRPTRFAFILTPPNMEEVKQQSVLAFDFLGYNPSPSSTAPANSETAFYVNSSLRLVLANHSVEVQGWKFLAGLGGGLFGWVPLYFPTTMGILPVSGVVSSRTTQLSVYKMLSDRDTNKLQAGLSLSRPAQTDSQLPNIDAGLRYSFGRKKAGFNNVASSILLESANVALSGTHRKFKMDKNYYGTAMALNTMLPIIPSRDSETENTMILVTEFSTGRGYAEVFPGASFNLPHFSTLDPGFGGYDSAGNFKLTKLQTWSVQLQYHLPHEMKSFVSVGYGHLKLKNGEGLQPGTGFILYDRDKTFYSSLFYDITANIRLGLEYRLISTEYVDGVTAKNKRYQFTTMFKF